MGRSEIALELCTEDLHGALVAERAGLDRIELCSALSEGGLTVSIGLANAVLAALKRTGVQFLLRPRPGHFVYDDDELSVMESDIAAILALDHAAEVGVGFVLGPLTRDRQVDTDAVRRLKDVAEGAPLTFHRGFDVIDDPARALDELVACGVDRVLTAGGAGTALDGADTLARLVQAAGDAITILAAGGIRPDNIARVVELTGAREVHFALRALITEPATRRDRPTLVGIPVAIDSVARTDAMAVASMVAALDESELTQPAVDR